MEDKGIKKSHKVVMDNRKTCFITNINDVISFDLKEVVLESDYGLINIKGKDLHVNRLSVEKGEVDLSGTIDSIVYSEVSDFKNKSAGFIGRLFR